MWTAHLKESGDTFKAGLSRWFPERGLAGCWGRTEGGIRAVGALSTGGENRASPRGDGTQQCKQIGQRRRVWVEPAGSWTRSVLGTDCQQLRSLQEVALLRCLSDRMAALVGSHVFLWATDWATLWRRHLSDSTQRPPRR